MPDPGRRIERWRWLGRLLPLEVRERIFDPALTDLLRESLVESGEFDSDGRSSLRALGTFLGCVPVAVPTLVVRRGRLTRLGKAGVWILAAVTVGVIVASRLSNEYAAYAAGG